LTFTNFIKYGKKLKQRLNRIFVNCFESEVPGVLFQIVLNRLFDRLFEHCFVKKPTNAVYLKGSFNIPQLKKR